MDFPGGSSGAYLRRELVAELGRHRVDGAVVRGELRRLWTGVLVEADRHLDLSTRAAGALLLHGERSVLCGSTSARLHGLHAAQSHTVHVLVPYGHCLRNRPGLRLHNGSIAEDDREMVDGLRVLGIARTVSDLLCTAHPRDALAIADQALASYPAQRREELRAQVSAKLRARRDPRGTRRGMHLLGLADGRAESPPESWLRLELVELGFPPPEANWPLYTPGGRLLYRLDLAWPDQRIAVEYNGYAVHADRVAEDARRAQDLRERGWLVIVATKADILDSRAIQRRLSEAFADRGYRRVSDRGYRRVGEGAVRGI